jgi:hypothetical protein
VKTNSSEVVLHMKGSEGSLLSIKERGLGNSARFS